VINFYFENVKKPKEISISIKKWIRYIVDLEKSKLGAISYVFCDNSYILDINIKFLNHHYFTDIITFNYNTASSVSGDIFISLDTVLFNANEYNVDFKSELLRVIIHGVLHLLGYDDTSSELQEEMTKKEDESIFLYYKSFDYK
jgi:probable rRNA maturation factor